MCATQTFDLTLKELGGLTNADRLASIRSTGVVFAWTLLPIFDMYVLNIFAPSNYVFWDFGLYSELKSSEIKAHFPLLSRDKVNQTHSVLTRLIKQAGHRKKSDFSRRMLGGWTNTPQFSGFDTVTVLSGLSFKHFSLLVPRGERVAVQLHFGDQIQCFAKTALRACDEAKELLLFDDIECDLCWKLLYFPILKTTQQDRDWLYAEASKYRSDDDIKNFCAGLDIRFAIRGLINLFYLPKQFSPFVNLEQYAEVLKFRIRVALTICPLLQVEKLLNLVKAHDEQFGEYPPGIKDHALDLLGGRLEKYQALIGFRYP